MPATIEEIRRRKRAHMARRRAANPDAAREQQRKWHAANRERNREKMRRYYARRFFWAKAMKLRSKNRASHLDLARLWKAQRGRCALTGRRLTRAAEVDHIHAKARGGDDAIENLRWVCREVNFARRDLPDNEFMALCEDVMRWIGRRIDAVERLSERRAA